MRRTRVILACTLGLAAVLLTLWGVAVQAQGGTTSYTTQALSGPATLPPGTYAGPCKPWVQVNDPAFGLDDPSHQSPPYASEEGFEVAVFSDSLYVGMEADNLYGTRVWRTRPGVRVAAGQDDWQQVVDDAFGDVANNDHIDSLEVFDGYLYASTAQRDANNDGTEVWRSDDGITWTQVNTDGFGIPTARYNENLKDLARFTVSGTSYLCGGTMNTQVGAQVWCTTGTLQGAGPELLWTQVNTGGFGATDTIKVWSTAVFSDCLYVGTEREAAPGTVWRTAGAEDAGDWSWEVVFTAPVAGRVDVVGVFSDALYIGFSDPTSGTQVYRSADGVNWTEVITDGFGDSHNGRAIVDAATVYNGALYLATLNQTNGAQVWRTTDGLNWTNVVTGGWGSTHTFAAELIPFNGYLYAWASDYYSGQKVLRSACPICQARSITGTGRFDFAGVGAVLTFTVESLDVVTVCVYPGAPPTVQTDTLPIARHYEIAVSPATGAFTADLTLSYTGAEFAASDVGDESVIYLTRWTGSGWAACPAGKRSRDTLSNTVTCRDVTAFSTWVIAGTDGAPSVVGGQTIVAARCLSPFRAGAFGALLLAVALAVGAVTRRRYLSCLPSRSSTAER